jgi:hypothetical protein
MKIAYLGSDAFADLLETSFETDTDKQMAILAHSDVEFYSLNSENNQLKIGDKCDIFVEANKKLFRLEFNVRNIIK